MDYRLFVIAITETRSFNNESKLDIKGKRMFKNMEKCEKHRGTDIDNS